VLFVFPLYVFKGGAFVTFRADLPSLTAASVSDKPTVSKILATKIGAQKNSIYEMMIFRLAQLNDVDPKKLQLIDTPLDQGFIAAEHAASILPRRA